MNLQRIRGEFVRSAGLIVTDRRWAGPLAGLALGFGLFIGVAVGPNAGGTFASETPMILEVADSGDEPTTPSDDPRTPASAPPAGGSSGGGGDGSSAPDLSLAPPSPVITPPPPATTTPTPTTPTTTTEDVPPDTDPVEEEVEDDGVELAGTVLHVNEAAGSYALVESGGALYSIHAEHAPEAGTKVAVPVRQLANGTYAEDGKPTDKGKESTPTFAGTVTFADADATVPRYTVSAQGVSVLVRVPPNATGAAPQLPEIGSFVTVTAEIADPDDFDADEPLEAPAPEPTTPEPVCAPDPTKPPPAAVEPDGVLVEQKVKVDGEPTTYSDFEGIVRAICPESASIVISADDLGQDEAGLLFTTPSAIDLTKVKPGDSVMATATIEEDGTLTLSGLASDEQAKGADNAKLVQGDLDRG